MPDELETLLTDLTREAEERHHRNAHAMYETLCHIMQECREPTPNITLIKAYAERALDGFALPLSAYKQTEE